MRTMSRQKIYRDTESINTDTVVILYETFESNVFAHDRHARRCGIGLRGSTARRPGVASARQLARRHGAEPHAGGRVLSCVVSRIRLGERGVRYRSATRSIRARQ